MVLNLLLVFFIAGLSAGSALPQLPSWKGAALAGIVCLFLLLLYIRFSQRLCLYLFISGLGLLWAIFYGHQLYDQRLPDRYASVDFLVEGTVINLPDKTERGERFDLAVDQVLRASVAIPEKFQIKKLRLNSYIVTPNNAFQYQPRQRWRLWVRLKPPRGMVNPGGFDYEGWLLQEGYSAVGYVRTSTENVRLEERTHTFSWLKIKTGFDHWGFSSLQWINSHIENIDQRALFAAIALGYKGEFTRRH
jgi:competence protein ComEC